MPRRGGRQAGEFQSSTSHLNLSRLCHCDELTTQRAPLKLLTLI